MAAPAGDVGVVERVASAPVLQSGLWDVGLPIFPAEILENLAVGEPARRCWMVLWRWSGCKPGYVRCDAGSLMSALGARSDRTVRGYRNELAQLGAIAIVDDGARWLLYVNEPAEASADRPRITTPGRYRYLAFMLEAPIDDPGSSRAKAPAGNFAHGGRGGVFLEDLTQQENPPPPHSEAGSFCAKAPAGEIAPRLADGAAAAAARPATAAGQETHSWPQAERRLRQAGLRVFRAAASQASSRGMSAAEAIAFVDFYERHRAAFDGPGALSFALGNWSPGVEPADPSLWPTPKHRFSEVERTEAERRAEAERRTQAERRAEAERQHSEQLEQRFGAAADALSDDEVELLLPLLDEFSALYVRSHRERPWSPVVRDRLIVALNKRAEAAG